jgi:hypothetical protein
MLTDFLLIFALVFEAMHIATRDVALGYIVFILVLLAAVSCIYVEESFRDITNLCPPCQKCPAIEPCPPCNESDKWSLPRWTYLPPDDVVKSQHRPELCANPVKTELDYYSPVDYTDFLNAFDDTKVGSIMPRKPVVVDYN